MGLYDRADMRFIWNGFLLKSFQKFDLKKYCLPIIMGFVSINQVNVNGNNFSWILISRRSIQRAGTRLFCRGIDQNVSIPENLISGLEYSSTKSTNNFFYFSRVT